jgi:hypothetical protein
MWSKAAGMRHILVHHYFQIDADAVWNVVEHDLRPLQERVRAILASFGPGSSRILETSDSPLPRRDSSSVRGSGRLARPPDGTGAASQGRW